MKITHKQVLADIPGSRIVKMKVIAPQVAKRAKAGQFVVIMVREEGERVPLTIVGTEGDAVTLIFQEAGLSTKLLGQLEVGNSLYAIVGPLGHATEIRNYGKVILVAGGVGIAEIYPVAKKLKETGNHMTIIIGARTKNILFLEEDLKKTCEEFYVTTDDGSFGRKGFTTDVLKELLEKEKYDLIYAVGPLPMMRKVSSVTKDYGVKTMVSLNTLMLDGTGMCGGCRVTVNQQTKFACVDGPEFDGHLVDWEEMAKRNRVYEDKERHLCQLYKL
jgi:ferredoxin/flavodoxin---NADP+ reductase